MSNQILSLNYTSYLNKKITHRLFSFNTIDELINNDFAHLNWETLGRSIEGRPIRMVRIGSGKTTLMLWSQMHGDEPTATAAIFDLLNFFKSDETLAKELMRQLNIVFIPVVNPDGLELFTRRNAQKIDINRDIRALQSPEAVILKEAFETVKPDFAFNLHDQSSLYCTPSQMPVGISLLAPAADVKLSVTWNREQAMKVIAKMNHLLQKFIPNQIARFKDEYEPRAFGDYFQKFCPTILVESGFLKNDFEKQEVRKLNFYALIEAFKCISDNTYQEIDIMNYLMIPVQSRNLLHVKISNCSVQTKDRIYTVDLGLIYSEKLSTSERLLEKKYELTEIGDLKDMAAYEVIDANNLVVKADFTINHPANISITSQQQEVIHEWKSGIRV